MTACVRRSLVEGPQAVALPPSQHSTGHLPEGRVKRNPRRCVRLALCDENVGAYETANLQLHGLQSRPERTK
jgi:hypothetical protein